MAKDTVRKIIIKADTAERAAKQVNTSSAAIVKLDKSASRAIQSLKGMAAGYVGLRGAAKILDFATESAKIDKMTASFNKMSAAAGMDEGTLKRLSKTTRGTIDQMDLLRQANQALLLGVVDSTEQFEDLFSVSRRLAGAIGKDVSYAVESLTTGIGRQSRLWLDNLGIIIDTERAYDEFAATLGKTRRELTDAEKKTAFNSAAMKEARRLARGLGEDNLTLADRMMQMKASASSAGRDLSVVLLPAINYTVSAIRNATQFWGEFLGVLGSEKETSEEQLFQNLQKAIAAYNREVGNVRPADVLRFDTSTVEGLTALGRHVRELGNMNAANAFTGLAVAQREYEESVERTRASLRPSMDQLIGWEREAETVADEVVPALIDADDAWLERQTAVINALDEKWAKTKRLKEAEEDRRRVMIGSVHAMSAVSVGLADMNEAFKGSTTLTLRLMQLEGISRAILSGLNTTSFLSRFLPPPIPEIAGGTVAAGQLALVSQMKAARYGADFITEGETFLRVGENPGGRERVRVEPVTSPNIDGPSGEGLVIQFYGGYHDEEAVQRHLTPMVLKAIKRGYVR